MITRCCDPRSEHYHRYGGRGITVCERWRDVRNFVADMGQPPPKLTLERIDNDGDYELSNCEWATMSAQRRNCSRPLRMIEFRGETLCLQDWSIKLGISYDMLAARLDLRKWPVEKAFTAPKYTRSPNRARPALRGESE